VDSINTVNLPEKLPKKFIIFRSESLGYEDDDTDIQAFFEMPVIATPEIFEKYIQNIIFL